MTKNKKALITGIAGFAGSHMAELLLSAGFEVSGIARWRSRTENIAHLEGKIKLFEADLLDAHSLDSLIADLVPDYIFHLAAQSFVLASWTSPAVTLETNIIGTANLFEAVRKAKIKPVIQIACSSEEYGQVLKNELPVKETNPLRPLSPYAVSKVAMDYLGYQYFKSYGLKIIRTRGFNHTGPRRGEVFAESNFAKQIAEIEARLKEPIIYVGNLAAARDYTDVRDMVKAYLAACEKCQPDEVYNIATGTAVKIGDLLKMLIKISQVKVEIKNDPTRLRPSDVPILIGDSSKFRAATGWKPEIPFEKTLRDLLDYWRERTRY